eukprot:358984-Chlamydomonas_euryale.AAC.3
MTCGRGGRRAFRRASAPAAAPAARSRRRMACRVSVAETGTRRLCRARSTARELQGSCNQSAEARAGSSGVGNRLSRPASPCRSDERRCWQGCVLRQPCAPRARARSPSRLRTRGYAVRLELTGREGPPETREGERGGARRPAVVTKPTRRRACRSLLVVFHARRRMLPTLRCSRAALPHYTPPFPPAPASLSRCRDGNGPRPQPGSVSACLGCVTHAGACAACAVRLPALLLRTPSAVRLRLLLRVSAATARRAAMTSERHPPRRTMRDARGSRGGGPGAASRSACPYVGLLQEGGGGRCRPPLGFGGREPASLGAGGAWRVSTRVRVSRTSARSNPQSLFPRQPCACAQPPETFDTREGIS